MSVRLSSLQHSPPYLLYTAHIRKTVKAKDIRVRETKFEKNVDFVVTCVVSSKRWFLFLFCHLKKKYQDSNDMDYVNFIYFIVTMVTK
jgi:hypothetical protein